MQSEIFPGFQSDCVTPERQGAVVILWLDNPPVNALGAALRHDLGMALDLANAQAPCRAIAILARGQRFSAGADISEFDKPAQAPLLPDLCDQIEASAKPVVVGLHGTTLGGGLEVALAAHARVALADSSLGFPEVGLGILPGAGGTQRLPRLIGAAPALQMMLTGAPVTAPQALAMGLLDKLVEQDLAGATVAMALDLAGTQPRRTRDRRDGFRDAKAYFAAVATARNAQTASPLPGPVRIVDCVEAAMLLPAGQGLAFERAAFAELVATPEAEALRHIFFAQRRAWHMLGASDNPLPVTQVSVLGTGPDAVALTHQLLATGLEVTLVDRSAESLGEGLEGVALALAADREAGRLSPADHDAQWDRLTPALPGGDGDAADLLFVTGTYSLPGAGASCAAVKAGAPIVTMGRLGDGGAHALGLMVLPETEQGRLAEVLVRDDTDPKAIATLLALLKAQKRLVVQGQGAGVIAGLAWALTAGFRAIEARHGPAARTDLRARWGMQAENERQTPLPAGPVDLWSGTAAPVLAALANAGLHMIGEGRALRPSDIDLAFVAGFGFPRWGGGPMLWAARRGLMVLRDDLHRLSNDNPDLWTPAPLLDDLIRQGISLADLNAA